ncbi:MAG TPA: CDP-glucose 4,6-dehydratase [Terriglobales bacterium]|nr:CDP-glucose 4,6-dehydratase [Terriglobales bacterium]
MAVKDSLEKFYKGKSVVVTGHTGFKGGWLAAWLKAMGSQVCGLALAPESGSASFFTDAQIGKGMNSVIGDIRDFASVLKLFKQCRPEIVFHAAAQALVLRSYEEPIETYATNVMGTVNVLEAARQTPSVRAVVIITSDKCYENREWIWGYREHDPMGGYDPYSSSKGCAELVTAAYRRSFFKDKKSAAIASARAGNVIGGGDWAKDRLIPDIIRGVIRKSVIPIRNPHALRPWQHVLEPLRGYLMLGQRLWQQEKDFAEAWNFGPHESAISVEQVARQLIELWGAGKLNISKSAPKMHEARYLKLDCSKAQALLGWRSLLTIEDALRLTVEWYRAVAQDPKSAGSITRDQIQRYMDLPC